jgi:hypothetical protein
LLLLLAVIVPGCNNLASTFFPRVNPEDVEGISFSKASVKGVVTSEATGRPLVGIKIGYGQSDVATDGNGEYSIPDLLPGQSYTIAANKGGAKGYGEDSVEIALEAGEEMILDFELTDVEPPQIALTKRPEDRTPLGADVEVEATITDNDALDRVILFYKVATGDETYVEVAMTLASADIYRGVIPKAALAALGARCYYYVYAEDKGGNKTPSSPPGDETASSTLVYDAEPPKISYPNPVIVGPLGAPATVAPTVTDNVGVVEVALFYRISGGGEYKEIKMAKATSGDTYSGVIPGEAVVEAGVEYYIQAKDGDGNLATWPANPPESMSLKRLSTITVTPNPATVASGSTQQFTAAVRDANNNAVSITPAWSVTASIGTINRNGLFVAGAAGTGTVVAALGDVSGNASVTVIPGPASSIAMASGDGQSGIAGAALANPLVVMVKDSSGNPVGGVSVAFSVIAGGGTLSATSSATGSDGRASAVLTLGTAAGTNTVIATSAGLSGSPVTFSATGLAGALASIAVTPNSATIISGNTQQFTAAGRDANNNTVSVTPTWSVTGGIGSITTGGLFSAVVSGSGAVVAASGSVSGSASLTVTPGSGSNISMVSGNSQSGTVGTTLPNPFVVIVRDANSNPVSGVSVAFAITSGNGSLSVTSVITGADGVASAVLTLGTAAGTNAVTATSTGLTGSPVTFSATGLSGLASSLAMVSGDGQSGIVGTTLPNSFVVIVKDANNNPVSGASVTFAITSGNGSLSVTSTTTGSDGKASTTLTLGTMAGANSVTATSTGLSGSPVTFSATGNVGSVSPTNSTVAAAPASVGADGVSTSAVTVTLKDANGNPISGHSVTVSSGSHATTIAPPSGTTDASGQAIFTVKSTQEGTAMITATDTTANVVITNTSSITFTDVTPPTNVTNLVATPGDRLVSLTWTASVSSDVSGYKVYTKVGAGPYDSGVDVGKVVSYQKASLTNGTSYTFKVTAYDEVPNESSGAEAGPSVPYEITPPGNITGFTVVQGSANGQITGSWTNPSDIDFVGVRFRYRTDGIFPASTTDGTLLGDKTGSPGAADSVTWSGLDPETTYYIRGFAYDDEATPNYASGTNAPTGIKPRDLTSPANVSSFTATPGDRQITLNWTNPTDVDFAGVRVVRKVGSAPASTADGTVVYNSTGTSYTDTNLDNATTYYYKAFAYDEVPNFSSGAAANATTPADVTPPANATNFKAVAGNNQVTLSWTNPGDSDFAGLRIVRKVGSAPASTTDGTVVYNSNSSETVYTDTTAVNGTTYHYRAYAHDEVPNYASGVGAAATPPNNDPPAITSGYPQASPAKINYGSTSTLTVLATDVNGDPVSFSWSATGSITGTGSTVTYSPYSPPAAGGDSYEPDNYRNKDYTLPTDAAFNNTATLADSVTVTASDGRGGTATASVTVITIYARLITPGATQAHTINPAKDVDWFRFEAEPGASYTVETFNLTGGVDTVMWIYGDGDENVDADGNGNKTDDVYSLDFNDDFSGLESRIDWTAPSFFTGTKTYYIRINDSSDSTGSSGAGYGIRLIKN